MPKIDQPSGNHPVDQLQRRSAQLAALLTVVSHEGFNLWDSGIAEDLCVLSSDLANEVSELVSRIPLSAIRDEDGTTEGGKHVLRIVEVAHGTGVDD